MRAAGGVARSRGLRARRTRHGGMWEFRTVYVVRRMYIGLLERMAEVVYGKEAIRAAESPRNVNGDSRLRRINSELEFGVREWKTHVFPTDGDDIGDFSPQAHAGRTARPGNGHSFDEDVGEARTRRHARDGAAAQSHPELDEYRATLALSRSASFAHGSTDIPAAPGTRRVFTDMMKIAVDAVESVSADSMIRCFSSEPPEPWNFLSRNAPQMGVPWFLLPIWLCGVWFRYCVLLPVRVFVLIVGTFSFCAAFFLVSTPCGMLITPSFRKSMQQTLLCYFASVFVASWGGYIRYHGERPQVRANQVYVANHTSLVDVFILIKDYPFSCIGQRHGGLAGALQDLLISVQSHVWFDREQGRDRRKVHALVKAHVSSPDNEPMLIFPEGTCVNNEYCIMFKKGAFELGVDVYPVAIRYDKRFADAYWNSSQTSFARHLLDLMTSWAVVADVWYLPPQRIRAGESASQFAARVKSQICGRAGLTGINIDGFIKRHRISPKFLEERQRTFAEVLKQRVGPSLKANARDRDASVGRANGVERSPSILETDGAYSHPASNRHAVEHGSISSLQLRRSAQGREAMDKADTPSMTVHRDEEHANSAKWWRRRSVFLLSIFSSSFLLCVGLLVLLPAARHVVGGPWTGG
ncbi:Glycerol-3-phosphate acyltransferase 3 [Porphyridium purpureum]|uniref:Glycerol-3-phosphate acyltransferase 3 n=1 Tax=Porphyridium purpureum TaxID=35688 RepID=A0A5J4YV74_PORPP|nr:Glycerol-3-phosphate acyltransferase 3 [Porphyridium purpureum]|eukprot:POR7961..scf229_5